MLFGRGGLRIEIHSVDTDRGVVLDTEIDVFADTETEVTGLREVALAEFVFLDLEATLENFLSLGATDGDVDSDLFVTTDTEGSDGVTGLACEKRCVRDRAFDEGMAMAAGCWATYCRREFDRSIVPTP